MLIRILFSVLLLLSILFMPFWVSIILALAGMLYFTVFWEAVVLFLLSDLLYGTREVRFWGIIFVSFIVAIMAFLIIEVAKKKMKFYS